MNSVVEPFACVPVLRPECAATVVIPAHDEAEHIEATLSALVEQRDLDGALFPPARFDVLVYANNCADATASIVRAFAANAPAHAIYVAEEWLAPHIAHIGTARRTAMHAAAGRYTCAGREGVLAGTDADTIPTPTWLAHTLRETAEADAVTGRILVDRSQWAALPEHTRRWMAADDTYLFAVARLESQLRPEIFGPWPRHWQRFGASFAVRVNAYLRAGGVPPVRVLEDVALYDALMRSGARIRQSLHVRVWTSARCVPRAPGGFGTRVATWNIRSADGSPLLVEHPETTLHRIVHGESRPCGDLVPIEEATAGLAQMIARGAIAERATRMSVASIAG